MNKLEEHYQDYDEESRLVKDNVHRIEFITTTHVLDDLIEDNSDLLEVGAATGRYSFHYLEQGHRVTAVEKVEKHVEIMKSKREENNYQDIDIRQGDARDLSEFEDNSFDVVLCLGPIYHLLDAEARNKVISECLRVLKPGGILAVAYINRYAHYVTYINRDKDNINDQQLANQLETGKTSYGDDRDCFYLSTINEIEAMMERFNIEPVDHVATDGIVNMMREEINDLDEEEFKKWVDFHLKTCRKESLLGYSRHALYVARKL